MRAIRLHPPGQIENLRLEDIDVPSPQPGYVLVRVHAAAVTRGELEWALDRLPATPSYELCGVVEQPTNGFAVGDEVIALTPFDRDGVAAELALVSADLLAPRPRSLDPIQAAALPMPGLTAWQALQLHGHLHAGERLAVTGPHGGVGHVAIQLARSLGAVLVDAGEPCALLFDTTGGGQLARAAGAAERIVTIAEEATGASYFVVEPDGEQLRQLSRLADAGQLRVDIDSVFPLHAARDAFTRATARGKRGKVVLRVTE
jgi:NADPH:quinone reductase-like Zn-dependent oxidoreductase